MPLKLRDLHKWLASAFGAGRPVRVEGEGAGSECGHRWAGHAKQQVCFLAQILLRPQRAIPTPTRQTCCAARLAAFMVGSHCEPKCLNGGKADLIIEIRCVDMQYCVDVGGL